MTPLVFGGLQRAGPEQAMEASQQQCKAAWPGVEPGKLRALLSQAELWRTQHRVAGLGLDVVVAESWISGKD